MSPSERKAHRVAGAFWWIEADGRIAFRSLSGGEVKLFTDAEIRSILDAFEDAAVEPLVDCWIYQVRDQPQVRVSLPDGGRRVDDGRAGAQLSRRDLESILAEQRSSTAQHASD